jgi:hypothetical protein
MIINLKKTESGGHLATAQRADGITVFAYGNDHPHRIPHELAHYVVENQLALSWGYWGSIAKGMMFHGMKVLEGDQSIAADKASSVAESVMERIGIAETLVSAVEEVLPHTATTPADAMRRQMLDKYPQLDGAPLADLDFPRLERLMVSASEEWAVVPAGGTLELRWQVPSA